MRHPVPSSRFAMPLLAFALLVFGSANAFAAECPPGSTSPDGQEPCTPCAIGRQAPSPGSMVCELCPIGTATNQTGTPECPTCPEGKIQPSPGQSTCINCPSGKTSDPTHTFCIDVVPGAGPWAQGALALLILGSALLFVRRKRAA